MGDHVPGCPRAHPGRDTCLAGQHPRSHSLSGSAKLTAACECDQIGPEERDYSRFFSQEQAIIVEMLIAAYLMLEGLGMIRGWLRNLHAAL
jgi:hypothetical protein